jgi:hypothetical protein
MKDNKHSNQLVDLTPFNMRKELSDSHRQKSNDNRQGTESAS